MFLAKDSTFHVRQEKVIPVINASELTDLSVDISLNQVERLEKNDQGCPQYTHQLSY